LTTGLWSYLNRQASDGANRPDFLWMGWPGASIPPEHEAAVALMANSNTNPAPFFAGGMHGPVLPRLLQQDDLAVVPLFPDADVLRGGELAGIPEHQPPFRRGGGERPAAGRRALDSRLPPDAAAKTVARKIPGRDRVVDVDTFPMGVEFDRFAQAATSRETELRVEELRQKCVGQKVIYSVDRLDYTKGLINRLRGYEMFLKNNPQWHGKVVFIISVAPSRIGVDSYQTMKLELEQTVGRIVGDFGNVHWPPPVYQFRNLAFEEIVPLYRLCDVALITPLRDGMNRVAKEFIASRPDQTGVLILSEMAGAAKEMGEALIINPFHREDFSLALEQALAMPVEEQIRRNQFLQERLRRYNVVRWADDFVQALLSTQKTEAARRTRSLTGNAQTALIQQYRWQRDAPCCWITTARWCHLPRSRNSCSRTRNFWNCWPRWRRTRPTKCALSADARAARWRNGLASCRFHSSPNMASGCGTKIPTGACLCRRPKNRKNTHPRKNRSLQPLFPPAVSPKF
jgi:glycosyltransferase involved in cell wall biosynthesis